MKNNGCFAAMTAAFTVAGASIGYGLRECPELVILTIFLVSFIGGMASYFCSFKD